MAFVDKRNNSLGGLARRGLNVLLNLGVTAHNQKDDGKLSLSRSETEDYSISDAYATINRGKLDKNRRDDVLRAINIQGAGSIPYYMRNYKERREELRSYSTVPEIEDVLDSLCDELIIYPGDSNLFCKVNTNSLGFKDDMDEAIIDEFRKVYYALGLHKDLKGWHLMRQYLIEGYLAFEILFDDNDDPQEITGIVEIDPTTLEPDIVIEDGERKVVWRQYETGTGHVTGSSSSTGASRIIPEYKIIMIAYNRNRRRFDEPVSYVERLIRNLNLFTTMEEVSVGWHLTNSQYRLTMILPVGNKATAQAKQALNETISEYEEDVVIDSRSGMVQVNGSRRFQFQKLMALPSRNGEEPRIDTTRNDGPDLSRMDSVEYFGKRFRRMSKLPMSRYDYDGGRGVVSLFSADGLQYEEVQFQNFLMRIRREFQKVIIEPLLKVMTIKHPDLVEDINFMSNLSLDFQRNDLFEQVKKQQILKEQVSFIGDMMRLEDPESREPYFALEFLVKNYLGLSPEELQENQELKAKESSDGDSDDDT